MTQYRSFEIRKTATGWQAARPTDMTWLDGYQARTAKDLKAKIDCHWNGF
jgi:hypothetical protein